MKNRSDISGMLPANITMHSNQGSLATPASDQTGRLSDGRSVQQVPSGDPFSGLKPATDPNTGNPLPTIEDWLPFAGGSVTTPPGRGALAISAPDQRTSMTTHSDQGSPEAPASDQTGRLGDGRSIQQISSSHAHLGIGRAQPDQLNPASVMDQNTENHLSKIRRLLAQVRARLPDQGAPATLTPDPGGPGQRASATSGMTSQPVGAGAAGFPPLQHGGGAFGASPVPFTPMPPPSAVSPMPGQQERADDDSPRLTDGDWGRMKKALKYGKLRFKNDPTRKLFDIMLWKARTNKGWGKLPESYRNDRKVESIRNQAERWIRNGWFEKLESGAKQLAHEKQATPAANDYSRVLKLAHEINEGSAQGRKVPSRPTPPSGVSPMPGRQEEADDDAPKKLTDRDWHYMAEVLHARVSFFRRKPTRRLLDIMLWKAETQKDLKELPESYRHGRPLSNIRTQIKHWTEKGKFDHLVKGAKERATEMQRTSAADDCIRVLELAEKINTEAKRAGNS